MPRPLRKGADGDIVHVTARGNRKQPIYHDDRDRILFLRLVGLTVARFGWELYAYCLMGNHYHLVIGLPVFNVSPGIQLLNGRYGQAFNELRALSGHLFQGRFRSEPIETDAHLLGAIRYVDLNPVRAGIVGHPDAWEWSSYRATVGHVRPPSFLAVGLTRELFHRDAVRGAAAYESFVEDALVSARAGV
jgi:putative transposase